MFDSLALEEIGRKIAAADAGACSEDELVDLAVGLANLRSLVDIGLGHVVGELDARQVCDRQFGLDPALWLAREARLPRLECRRVVRDARKLRHVFGDVDAAVVDGRLMSRHAAAICASANRRVIDKLADIQHELIDNAQDASFEVWEGELKATVELLDEDGSHNPHENVNNNTLSWAETLDGVLHLKATFVGELAQLIPHAIDQLADELFRACSADHELAPDVKVPHRSVLRALGFGELRRRGLAVDLHASKPPRTELTLIAMATYPLVSYLPTGVRCPDSTVQLLQCDPYLYPMIVNTLGKPVDLNDKRRFATDAQRKALAVRDGGCCFPGCDAPIEWLDIHHIKAIRNGGLTTLRNLVGLCRRHHGIVHRNGWSIHQDADGWHWFQTPSGQTFWAQRHQRFRTNPPPSPVLRPAA